MNTTPAIDRSLEVTLSSRWTGTYELGFAPIGHGFDRRSVDAINQPPLFHSSIERRCAVYRFFNPAGALLYVGIANDYETRFRQHADSDRGWWRQWSWYTLAWYDNRVWAAAVEAHAIVAEYPAYNVTGRPEETNYPWGEPGNDDWDYNERYDTYTLNLLYGQWRRAETLEPHTPKRMWVHPGTAKDRYEAAVKQAAPWSRYWHGMWLPDFQRRERIGGELLASRLHAKERTDASKGAPRKPPKRRRRLPALEESEYRVNGGGGAGPKVNQKVRR